MPAMEIDRESLRRHYASMSDEELLALNYDELTEVAQDCYDDEIIRRKLVPDSEASAKVFEQDGDSTVEAEPDWMETAAIACSFQSPPGVVVAPKAAQACDVLRAAGIPAQINVQSPDGSDDSSPIYLEYQVMVPGALTLMAASVLDTEIFNPELEDNWRALLEGLSDEDLRALTPANICAGFLDRAARLKRAYEDEIAKR
jgi:hypothetical protein